MTKKKISRNWLIQQCQKLAHKLTELSWADCNPVFIRRTSSTRFLINRQTGQVPLHWVSKHGFRKAQLDFEAQKTGISSEKRWTFCSQIRIFLSAFKSNYSISHLRNCTPAWLFKLLSMQQLAFSFTGGGKNYMFWKVRLWVSSWETQEAKHCLNILTVGCWPSEHILPEKWECWYFFQPKKKFSIFEKLEFQKIGKVLLSKGKDFSDLRAHTDVSPL